MDNIKVPALKPYTTTTEKNFIDGIGKGIWSEDAKVKKFTRLKLLNKYMQALVKRLNFGDINEQVALQYLHQSILDEKAMKLEAQKAATQYSQDTNGRG